MKLSERMRNLLEAEAPPTRPTPAMDHVARRQATGYLNSLHSDTLADLSGHDRDALKDAMAWAILRFIVDDGGADAA